MSIRLYVCLFVGATDFWPIYPPSVFLFCFSASSLFVSRVCTYLTLIESLHLTLIEGPPKRLMGPNSLCSSAQKPFLRFILLDDSVFIVTKAFSTYFRIFDVCGCPHQNSEPARHLFCTGRMYFACPTHSLAMRQSLSAVSNVLVCSVCT